ncbi:2,5-dioxovalerate dehydrogenase [Longispora fulva]|uniref:NADP-dependent aldehyde dehydrogenase n=1 Tax=Longispora fulva TaxID=619741 RepID=A0A8J7GCC5_9ACTN|nr:aldehyde dehydrogenase family protein [Longispora fulva]MBG6133852.1 NADP-dependent aldehyde dehydrogenase [Longispora fulva]GIG62892.1 2,5-dioxovalerate dehydrogenase [Longispora fulva]
MIDAALEFFRTPWPAADRRAALHACADALAASGDEIVDVVGDETGLLPGRLRAELDRTTGQLRTLGDEALAPWRRASPGIVTVPVPVGPVAVFAASNFPLAFGVAGGDTASALAAGCPVIVKAHSAQPRTSRLLATILEPVLPKGAFAVFSGGRAEALDLVRNPGIRAVGFTGSLTGGRALMDAAAARPDPIAVYAEMGSLNPVFVLPGTPLEAAALLAQSVTGSSGQLCTKPGLVVTPSRDFANALADAVSTADTHRMLTAGMAGDHAVWLASARRQGHVVAGAGDPVPFALIVPAACLDDELLAEHFGPSVVIAVGDLAEVVPQLEGSLTATVFAGPDDEAAGAALVPALMARAGRVIWNQVPTGVVVCAAQHHGGPWPASSAPWSTSVGTASIERFRRPVALQGLPTALLPS